MNETKMINLLGGRKAAALLIMALLGIGTVVWKGDVPANFLSLMEFLFAAYVAGNVGSKLVGGAPTQESALDTTVEQVDTTVPSAPANLTPVLAAQEEIKTAVAASQQGISAIQETLAWIIQVSNLGKR